MQDQIPKWAMRFIEKTCSSQFLDELQGDLLELFYRDIDEIGIRAAKRRFIWKALLSPRWYRLPQLGQFQSHVMYKSHFKVAFRHALKHRSATTVQALGLILGLAAVFFIGLFIKNELTFDQMHENRDSLYRVLRFDPTTGERSQGTSSLHGAKLVETYPFLSMARFGNDPVKMGEVKPRLVEDFFWADSTFFDLFTFQFIHGNPATCLREVNSLVITAQLSRQLFGTEDALGRMMPIKVYDGDQEFLMKITGIVEDPPKHSHIQFEALGAMANAEILYKSLVKQWGFSWVRTYIQVPDDRIGEVEAGIPNLIRKYHGESPSPRFGMTFQPFSDVYLHSQDIPRNTFRGSIRNIRIFGTIGLLILIISLMNYVNLATARAITRVKEIGIRKTLGSRKAGIVGQFIIESILFSIVSGLVALLLVFMGIPRLNALFDLDLSFSVIPWTDWVILSLLLVFLGVVAGLLPSLVMARIPVLGDAKSPIQFKISEWSLTRKFFVGVQYVVTMVLLVSTFAIYKQYIYLKHFDLGFDSTQLLHVAVDDRVLQEKLTVLKERMIQLSGVVGVTATGEDLPSKLNNSWDLEWNGSDVREPKVIDIIGVDQEYFDVLGIGFKAGRNFNQGFEVDSARSVILNSQAQSLIGQENLVGQQITIGGTDRKVIGVVENHHNTTLHSQISPLAYFIFPPGHRVSPDNLLIKIETGKLTSLLHQMEAVWGEFSSDPFRYNFVDEAFATAYSVEQRFSALIGFFTIIAIAISMVGLFGLVSFIVQLKLKEISIRRILGATQLNLIRLLGHDFFVVFLIALVFAIPIALHFINSWLTSYAYHIQVTGFIIIPAVLLSLSISVLVILYHLQRTSRMNPSDVLSSE